LSVSRSLGPAGLGDSERTATPGSSRQRARSALVVVEVALVVVVIVATGLVVRSFLHVLRVDTGFRSEQLLTVQIAVPGDAARSPDGRRAWYARLLETLTAVPGVVRVGGTTRLPLGGADSTTGITRESSGLAEAEWPVVDLRRALFDYFGAMEMSILRGRGFDERDGPDSPPAVVINQTLARLLFGDANPIGERVQLGANAGIERATIIGIVADIRHRDLETPAAPEVYIRAAQNPPVAPIIAIRTAGDAGAAAPAIRRALEDAFPEMTMGEMRAMQALRANATAPRRFVTTLVSVFGVLGLTLAAAGVYGLTSLAATARLRELAIRQALGAARPSVVRLVVGHSTRVAALGLALGLGVALLATPALRGLLFGVRPSDPATYALVAGVLLLTTLVAAGVPAVRASRIDPVVILRREG
jgi:predicted permease